MLKAVNPREERHFVKFLTGDVMPKAKKARKEGPTQNDLDFPSREKVASGREYDEKVTRYWEAIDFYRAMAVDLHEKLVGRKAVPAKNGAKK